VTEECKHAGRGEGREAMQVCHHDAGQEARGKGHSIHYKRAHALHLCQAMAVMYRDVTVVRAVYYEDGGNRLAHVVHVGVDVEPPRHV
jgi:hypothetical protein